MINYFSNDTENQQTGQYILSNDAESPIIKIQHLEIALEQAVQNITQLQNHLSFMLAYHQELNEEKRLQEKKYQLAIEAIRKQLDYSNQQVLELKENHQEYSQLLAETKESLENSSIIIKQKDDELKQKNRIINEQRSAIESIQEQLLNYKYSADISLQNVTQGNLAVAELQKQLEDVRYENKRLQNALEKQLNKSKKSEKENTNFKSWLCANTGVNRVVEGCEKVLLDQLTNRLQNCIKY